METWFTAHLDVVFFVYGLSFVLMGVFILTVPKKGSLFRVSSIMWLLAGFGLMHGVNEWLDMWSFIKGRGPALDVVRSTFLVGSYLMLFEFGRRFLVIAAGQGDGPAARTVRLFCSPWTGPALGLMVLALALTSGDFWRYGSIWCRYLFGFTGSVLTGAALTLYYRGEEGVLRKLPVGPQFMVAGQSFVAYGLLGGLVVPEGDFFPANWLNTASFLDASGVPVQVFRTVLALGAAVTVAGILRIFNWETRDRLSGALAAAETVRDNLEAEVEHRTGELTRLNEKLTGELETRRQNELKIVSQSGELMVLYEISSAAARTMDTTKLLENALRIVTRMGTFSVDSPGGVLLVEGDRMLLAAHLGHPEEFLKLHEDLKVGDCLCGRAALSGEVIVSTDSDHDERHTIRYPGMRPHGHVIVPLKAKDEVMGVMYLYTPAGSVLSKGKMKLLESVGSLLGMAVKNSRLYERARTLSMSDPLTGLANRRSLDTEVRDGPAGRSERATVIMLDIDRFKEYNDRHGHQAGDELLAGLAGLVKEAVRDTDVAARYGGEELIIVLPGAGLDEGRAVAERIRTTVEKNGLTTVSLGVAEWRPGGEDFDSAVAAADKALYRAKGGGRNRVVSDPSTRAFAS